MPQNSQSTGGSTLLSVPALCTAALLGLIIAAWTGAVNTVVTEPYLDEYFHVRQAQKYIQGRFQEWDDKITTPPGLYVLSTAIARITGLSSLSSLRALNAILLPILLIIVVDLDVQLGWGKLRRDNQASRQNSHRTSSSLSKHSLMQLHTALNICLFPVLFFYSALYYTDIASVTSVLICWHHFVRIHEQSNDPTIAQAMASVTLGLISLSFRQTNIFWVSIFPLAIIFVSYVDAGLPQDPNEDENLLDPPVRESHVDDYIFFLMSLVTRTVTAAYTTFQRNWAYLRLVKLLLPYLTILAAFAAFVVWNGGVVLGDKSNHIATIHFAQLLYLWPYMMFFSAPLALAYLIQGFFGLLLAMPVFNRIEYTLMFRRKRFLPRYRLFFGFALIAAAIIYYNTIIHPFTLADNRHYPFYVFRLLTRHRMTKYAVVPIYYIGAWATIQTLGAPAAVRLAMPKERQHDVPVDMPVPKAERVDAVDKAGPPPTQPLLLNHAAAGEGATVSFVFIWLATTALTLVTAPLVEPRYFIVPWLMWRLRVPQAVLHQREAGRQGESAGTGAGKDSVWAAARRLLWHEHDHRLWLETAWFVAINLGTGYMFLYRGFEWVQEPGKVQRFMW